MKVDWGLSVKDVIGWFVAMMAGLFVAVAWLHDAEDAIAKVAEVEAAADALDQRIDKLESVQAELRSDIRAVGTEVNIRFDALERNQEKMFDILLGMKQDD